MPDDAAADGGAWTPYESGSTIGQRGSDDGLIMGDEEYCESARITLERDCRAYGKPAIPFTITCGIYGLMVHTRFFGDEFHARQQLNEMKTALATLVDQLPADCEDEVPDGLEKALDEFVYRYP